MTKKNNENLIQTKQIRKYKQGKFFEEQEKICAEYELDIYINDNFYITVMCLNEKLKEFAVGFLFFEGVIDNIQDIKDIKIQDNKININLNKDFKIDKDKKKVLTTGCGTSITGIDMKKPAPCKKIDIVFRLSPENIIDLMNDFNKKSIIFLETGCVHSCAIADKNSIIIFAEDIGRHNAFDKVIGYCLANNIDLTQKVFLTSGRITSEMAAKAIKAKIPIIISRSAPTTYAVKLAEYFLITLIGFARGERFNMYAFPERVLQG